MSIDSKLTPANVKPGTDDRGLGEAGPVRKLLSNRATWILALDVVLIALFAALSGPNIFLSQANFQAMMLNGSQALILSLGLSMMLGAGAFDLSLGANLVLSSVVGAAVMKAVLGTSGTSGQSSQLGMAITLTVLACVVTGLLFGAVNGVLIAYFNMNSLIATLGTLGVGSGLALVVSNGSDIGGMPSQLQSAFGFAKFFGIPLPALMAVAITLILWAIVRFTRFGLRTLAMGSSRSAAERAGLRVRPQLLVLTMLAGGLAGLAGFLDLATFGSTSINGHANAALAAATAVVIGGTLIDGGRIAILGTVWGAALAIILQSGLVILGVSSAYQLVAVGAVLIFAVGLDRLTTMRRKQAK